MRVLSDLERTRGATRGQMIREAGFISIDQLLFDNVGTGIREHIQEVGSLLFDKNDQRILIGCKQAIIDERKGGDKTGKEFI